MVCLSFLVLTQLTGIRLWVVLLVSALLITTGIVIESVT